VSQQKTNLFPEDKRQNNNRSSTLLVTAISRSLTCS